MTAFLLALCLTSASSRLLFNEKRLVRRSQARVVANTRKTASSPSRSQRHRRWRSIHQFPSPFTKNLRAYLAPPPLIYSCLRRSTSPVFASAASSSRAPARNSADLLPISAFDRATVEHLFELSSGAMDGPLLRAAPMPALRTGNRTSTAVSSHSSPELSAFTREAKQPRSGSSKHPRQSKQTNAHGETATAHSSEAMPPPPPSQSTVSTPANGGVDPEYDSFSNRPSRSASTASRTNRLSLTLPIAPPNAFPSRPMPSAGAAASVPSTPIDAVSGLALLTDPAELITAIAAQERRVLEIREDLLSAETNLAQLKKQWQSYEIQRKRAEIRRPDPLRSFSNRPAALSNASATEAEAGLRLSDAMTDDGTDSASKRSIDLDRRRALLLGQHSGPSTPTQSKRRVFTGSHTRALSLLSPTRTSASDGFAVHDDHSDEDESMRSPASSHEPDSPFYQNLGRYAPLTAAQLSKRSSWAPSSVHQAGVFKQVAGDLTATLWTFVEDIRQATVGDEINGSSYGYSGQSGHAAMRSIDSNVRSGNLIDIDDEQPTIRASTGTGRPHLPRSFTAADVSTPPPATRHSQAADQAVQSATSSSRSKITRSDSKKKSGKHFSWTPLTVDEFDDNDWASWDSPTATVKSPRWSGSTVSGDAGVMTPGKADENSSPLKNSTTASPSSANKSGDIQWPSALNRLTPGNIKRTATDLMKEWEKSLALPHDGPTGETVKSE